MQYKILKLIKYILVLCVMLNVLCSTAQAFSSFYNTNDFTVEYIPVKNIQFKSNSSNTHDKDISNIFAIEEEEDCNNFDFSKHLFQPHKESFDITFTGIISHVFSSRLYFSTNNLFLFSEKIYLLYLVFRI